MFSVRDLVKKIPICYLSVALENTLAMYSTKILQSVSDTMKVVYKAVIRVGALVQWLKLPAWKVGDRGFEPHFGLQVSKKQNVSSPLTREDSILWGASVTGR